ncbi:DEKNAAC104939 [Brettanomyces naardenensis]|uniref:DEKNAAC104939 n=1 Tax=Brettanomyces naardenensis TaxID=13370 RepID=A0A448YSG7_BRENA|nr:DEKNAAC104939 [Brettanomyces naardenensis]
MPEPDTSVFTTTTSSQEIWHPGTKGNGFDGRLMTQAEQLLRVQKILYFEKGTTIIIGSDCNLGAVLVYIYSADLLSAASNGDSYD